MTKTSDKQPNPHLAQCGSSSCTLSSEKPTAPSSGSTRHWPNASSLVTKRKKKPTSHVCVCVCVLTFWHFTLFGCGTVDRIVGYQAKKSEKVCGGPLGHAVRLEAPTTHVWMNVARGRALSTLASPHRTSRRSSGLSETLQEHTFALGKGPASDGYVHRTPSGSSSPASSPSSPPC